MEWGYIPYSWRWGIISKLLKRPSFDYFLIKKLTFLTLLKRNYKFYYQIKRKKMIFFLFLIILNNTKITQKLQYAWRAFIVP